MFPVAGDDGPSKVEAKAADLELHSGQSFVVILVNSVMAAMTFGAVASMVMVFGRLLR